MKKNNIFLLIMLIIILCFGVITMIKDESKFSIPENRNLTHFPKFTLKNYFNNKYQAKLENALQDQFIFSEEIKIHYNDIFKLSLLKKMKKNFCTNNYISVGNGRYMFDCDDYMVFNANNSLENGPGPLLANIDKYNKLNNEIDSYYYFVTNSLVFNFKTNSLVIDVPKIVEENMKGKYKFDYLKFNNYQEYKKYFYKNDHHWNYKGSYQGYKDIIKMLAPNDEIKKPIKEYIFKDISFFGSHSQFTRIYSNKDIFKVYRFNIPKYKTYVNRNEEIYGNKDSFYNGNYNYSKYDDYYSLFYGEDYAEVIFDFNNPQKDNLLIITNSYSDPINDLISSHFNKTYIIDFRFYYDTFNKPLNIRDYIKENNIDKILFLEDFSLIGTMDGQVGLEE